MSHINKETVLGQFTTYPTTYSPEVLFPIDRANSRKSLHINANHFQGVDRWIAYEMSWLNLKGKPEVAIAEFIFPCTTPFLIESKSFKLYLNSLNQTHFASHKELEKTLTQDLSKASGGQVLVHLSRLQDMQNFIPQKPEGSCLDDLDVSITNYQYNPSLLKVNQVNVQEHLYTDLFRSNCPVTAQPDWATICIGYQGKQIDAVSLLSYFISFREHQGFHEECVERIYSDLMHYCHPQELTVYAQFTRRGGLDINPYRSNTKETNVFQRFIRQ